MDFKEVARELGKRGGLKVASTHTSEHYREMQRKGVEVRLKRKILLGRSIAQNAKNRG